MLVTARSLVVAILLLRHWDDALVTEGLEECVELDHDGGECPDDPGDGDQCGLTVVQLV